MMKDYQLAEKISIKELAYSNLRAYVSCKFNGYRWADHLILLSKYLMAVESGKIKRLMIFAPPRHGKTHLISEFFPAWYLGRNPENQIIAATYSFERAKDVGRTVRNQFLDPAYYEIFPSSGVDPNNKSSTNMALLAGGKYVSVGVGGAVTGRGADLFLIDDPIKGRRDADSEASRRQLKEWFKGVAYTRLMPGGAIVIVLTRWHFDDLAGFLLEETGNQKWTVLKFQAICEEPENDPIKRKLGEALWPKRYPIDTLRITAETIGTREWNSQYQQNPLPAEGGMVKIENFQRYEIKHWLAAETAVRFGSEKPPVPFGIKQLVISLDTAFKESQLNDPSAFTIWGVNKKEAYLLKVICDRMNFPKLEKMAITLCNYYGKFNLGPVRLLVEDKASGQSLIQSLRMKTSIPVIACQADANKTIRMDRANALIEAGRVYLPTRAEWLIPYETEMLRFPLWKHDDMVDSTSQFLNWFGRPRYVINTKRKFWK